MLAARGAPAAKARKGRRRPGRPAVHTWVDLPDESLTEEQQRQKRAILQRRARQNLSYARRRSRLCHSDHAEQTVVDQSRGRPGETNGTMHANRSVPLAAPASKRIRPETDESPSILQLPLGLDNANGVSEGNADDADTPATLLGKWTTNMTPLAPPGATGAYGPSPTLAVSPGLPGMLLSPMDGALYGVGLDAGVGGEHGLSLLDVMAGSGWRSPMLGGAPQRMAAPAMPAPRDNGISPQVYPFSPIAGDLFASPWPGMDAQRTTGLAAAARSPARSGMVDRSVSGAGGGWYAHMAASSLPLEQRYGSPMGRPWPTSASNNITPPTALDAPHAPSILNGTSAVTDAATAAGVPPGADGPAGASPSRDARWATGHTADVARSPWTSVPLTGANGGHNGAHSRPWSDAELLQLFGSLDALGQRCFVRLPVFVAPFSQQAAMSVVAGEAEAGIGPTEPAHPPRDRLDLSAPGIEKALQELVRVRLLSVSGSFFCTHPSWSQLVQRLQRSDSMPDPALAPLHALVRQQMPLAEVHFTQYYFALVAEGSGRSLDLYRIGGVRARAMRMLCYNSDNIMRAMEWARRSPTPAQLLVPFLLHGRAVLRFCVPARFRRDCYAAALEMIGYHQCKADLVPSDDDAADDASEATRLHQCMFVRYMPATRDESLLLCGLGEAYLDGLHIREAAIPLQESLRFFFSECSNALQVPEQRYQAIDEACLDEEIQRLQSGASGSPSSRDSDSSDAADRAKDISMVCKTRMLLRRLDMLIEAFARRYQNEAVKLLPMSSPQILSGASVSPVCLDASVEREPAYTALVHGIVPLLLLSQVVVREGCREEAYRMLMSTLRLIVLLGLTHSTLCATATTRLVGLLLSMGKRVRARDTCTRALDVLHRCGFGGMPIYADALGMLGAANLLNDDFKTALINFSGALEMLESWFRAFSQAGPHPSAPVHHCRELVLWLSIGLARTYLALGYRDRANMVCERGMEMWRMYHADEEEEGENGSGSGGGAAPSPRDGERDAYQQLIHLLPAPFRDFGYLRHVY